MYRLQFLVVAIALMGAANAHSRWACPKARNPNTGLKNAPCDVNTGDFSAPVTEIHPGPFTVVFEEQIFHHGAPFGIFLSKEGDDSFGCQLLDHIPHNDQEQPTPTKPFVQYKITLQIPDIKCDKCSISLYNAMTDKLPLAGMKECTYMPNRVNPGWNGTCFSVYHSCTTLRILGSKPLTGQADCPQPAGWPYTNHTSYLYSTGESGVWKNSWLTGVPAAYSTPAGPCASAADYARFNKQDLDVTPDA
jgi:hypothetical protein